MQSDSFEAWHRHLQVARKSVLPVVVRLNFLCRLLHDDDAVLPESHGAHGCPRLAADVAADASLLGYLGVVAGWVKGGWWVG